MAMDETIEPSVMILSAAAATGHLRAAEALVSAFEMKGVPARHVEVLGCVDFVRRRHCQEINSL